MQHICQIANRSCGIFGGMKEKTSVTLSKEVLSGIDRLAGSKQSRSAFIESVLAEHIRARARAERDARDVAIINRNTERLNREALDVLEYQAPVGEFPEE
jgi:metal-responsive CopG/Arc/MetJ family transcriptional regulator